MVLTIALNACDIFAHAVTLKRWISGKKYECVTESEEERQELVQEPKDDEASPFTLGDDGEDELDALAEEPAHRRTDSTISGDTLFDSAAVEPVKVSAKKSLRTRALELAPKLHSALMCSLVVLAYAEVISGIVVYTGTCVGRYGNGCADSRTRNCGVRGCRRLLSCFCPQLQSSHNQRLHLRLVRLHYLRPIHRSVQLARVGLEPTARQGAVDLDRRVRRVLRDLYV